ncbi:GspH/FimT family pseudopilin [Pseudomonas entomophila]|uniref:GspH/FimT family pseudopilin n=1 Tax=Pseudomonas entomophila TaxID=312306 RepID=UPI0023D7CD22|nr:GspH/FimT family pseudopilin [Pseudomonas entomophila]MDF0729160.1 GspH/FimT family pseudopilin [Pseudomonas entomophila]
MRQQGATLIQMMIALSVVGLLVRLGAPSYASLSEDLHLAAAARDLAQTLRSARSHASLQHAAVRVQPLQEDWGVGWRVLLEHDGQVLREQRLVRRVRIVANLGEVRFSGLGVPQHRSGAFFGGTLAFCKGLSGLSSQHVVVAPSGRVSLRTGASDQPRCASR